MSGPRVAPVAPGTRPELADLEERITAARGEISPLYQVLLNSRPLVAGWEAMMTVIRQQTSISPRVREMVILRIAVLNRAPYEFEAHVRHARAAGLSDEIIDQLRVTVSPDALVGLEPGDADVLALTDAMTRDIEVPDSCIEPLRGTYDDQGLIELAATVASYNMVSRFLVAMRIHP